MGLALPRPSSSANENNAIKELNIKIWDIKATTVNPYAIQKVAVFSDGIKNAKILNIDLEMFESNIFEVVDSVDKILRTIDFVLAEEDEE